ncbi:MAG: sugar porter family MFS transporter [Phocaeicola sp.]
MYRDKKSYLLFVTFISAMGGLLFGYDWVVIGGAKIFYEPFFEIETSAALRGWAMSSALIGCLVGALLAGAWNDRYGRKKMLLLAALFFTLSAYGTGAVDHFTGFIAYRLLGGLGIGMASTISPIYIAEISPASIRGRLVSLNQLTIVLGILSAQLVNWQIGNYYLPEVNVISAHGVEWAWRWMFWAELIPAGAFLILALFIPESPRWLALNHRREEAYKVFSKVGGAEYASLQLAEVGKSMKKTSTTNWKELLHPKVRQVLFIGIVLAIFQQWCGINVIFNYAHEIFSAAGYAVSDVLMNIVITGVTNLLFTLVAIYTVDRWGRRALMYIGSVGLGLIYLLLGLFYHFQLTGLPMLLLVVLAIACYAMSLAPMVWVILSEIFPARIRGAAMALSTFFLWVASFLLTYTFPLLNQWLQASGTFWVYGTICFMGFLFIHFFLPETKGKSLEEIEQELVK